MPRVDLTELEVCIVNKVRQMETRQDDASYVKIYWNREKNELGYEEQQKGIFRKQESLIK